MHYAYVCSACEVICDVASDGGFWIEIRTCNIFGYSMIYMYIYFLGIAWDETLFFIFYFFFYVNGSFLVNDFWVIINIIIFSFNFTCSNIFNLIHIYIPDFFFFLNRPNIKI
jgi:hypothetical protein